MGVESSSPAGKASRLYGVLKAEGRPRPLCQGPWATPSRRALCQLQSGSLWAADVLLRVEGGHLGRRGNLSHRVSEKCWGLSFCFLMAVSPS